MLMLVVIFSILNHMETSGLFGNYRWEISVHLAKIVFPGNYLSWSLFSG